jgi:hypothetical protein
MGTKMARIRKGRIVLTWATTLVFIVAIAIAQFSPLRAQDRQQPTKLGDLRVAQAKRTTVEGKSGIEITFDRPSADRVRRFTGEAVGRSIIVEVNHRALSKLRVLDPIADGNILLTGDLDSEASEALFSRGATVNLKVQQSPPNR